MIRFAAFALASLILIGCGSGPVIAPTPTPASMDDVIAALVLRRLTIHQLVSGDPGCPGSELHSNAVRLEVAIDDRSATHAVYFFRWRRAADFAGSTQTFADCVAAYKALHPATAVSQVESEPWRAYGPGWAADLAPRLLEAFQSVGGD